ncbi:hypothetical protein HDU98_000306 [Podochytrium sp. JEL0797]|nr:hypothetical protein HDU98_000306 [Podochytrium sp. JEL0797]
MLFQSLVSFVAGALVVAAAPISPVERATSAANRVIGYHQSWYFYDSPGNVPIAFSPNMKSSYTHINYAFATIAYHTATQQFYVDFTDSYADYQACVSLKGAAACPSQCIPVPAAKQCTGGKVSMVPYIGANGTCPDTACYNPSSAPGAPRIPACEAVLDSNAIQTDANGNPMLCGNYAYVLKEVKPTLPNTKFMISIGGWYDSNLFSAATEPQYIDAFVKSIVKFVEFFGFDGVDFDWEYPGWEHGSQAPFKGGPAGTGNAESTIDCSVTTCAYPGRTNDMAKFNSMVTKVRAALKALGKTAAGSDYLISMAAPAGYDKMNKLDIKTVCSQMDYINIMTYDIHGEWESSTNHQAPLYDNTPANQLPLNGGVPETSVDFAVNYWVNNGCPANQVVVGVPFYAHAWKAAAGSTNGLFQPGTASTVTKLNYKDMVADSSIATYWDATAQASYGYSTAQGTFYSFDTPQAISAKVGYGAQKGLGGFMVWPIDGDSNDVLLKALVGPGTTPPPPPSGSAVPPASTASKTAAPATSATTTAAAPVTTPATTVAKATTTSAAAPVTTATTSAAKTSTTTAAATTAAITTAAVTTAAVTTAAVTTAAPTTAAATTAAATTAAATTAGAQATPCYPAFVLGTAYNGAAQVSYNSVNYVAKWWESGTATPDVAGDGGWSAQGPCGSGAPVTTAVVKTTTAAVVPVTSTTAAVVKTTAVVPPTTAAAQPTTAASGSIVGQVCPTYAASQCVTGTMYVCGGAGPYAWAVWYTGC